jgi:hypothetical protein
MSALSRERPVVGEARLTRVPATACAPGGRT